MALTFKLNTTEVPVEDDESNIINLTNVINPYLIDTITIGNQTIKVENEIDLTPALDTAIEEYLEQNINPKSLKVGNEFYIFNNGVQTLDITNPIVDIIKEQFEPIKTKLEEQKGEE